MVFYNVTGRADLVDALIETFKEGRQRIVTSVNLTTDPAYRNVNICITDVRMNEFIAYCELKGIVPTLL